jgi:hypothetical protein
MQEKINAAFSRKQWQNGKGRKCESCVAPPPEPEAQAAGGIVTKKYIHTKDGGVVEASNRAFKKVAVSLHTTMLLILPWVLQACDKHQMS